MEAPAVAGLGLKTPWTSGVLSSAASSAARRRRNAEPNQPGSPGAVRASEAHVALETRLGSLRVRLADAASPAAARWVREMAARGPCSASRADASTPTHGDDGRAAGRVGGCRFYRAEPVPREWGRDYAFGPPYALLQGSFLWESAGKKLEKEGGTLVRRGTLIAIDRGPDFLIGLAAHPEWATSYTYLGDVVADDLRVLDAILAQPLTVKSWGTINATTLDAELPFRLRELRPDDGRHVGRAWSGTAR